jgi:hypothetical protein
VPAPEVEGSGAAYARFYPAAQAIEGEAVIPMRADASLAYHNVAAGVAAVMEYAGHVEEHLPQVDLREIRSLPDLASAVAFAARQVPRDEELRPLLAEAYALRRKLLAAALALAEEGVFTAREVAKVKPRRGAFDVAADCAALGAMFEKKAGDVEGQAPVTAEQWGRASELGCVLKAMLKPKGSKRAAAKGEPNAAEALDRLWTLLVERHERLWAIGAYVFGHAVDEHVPALLGPLPKGAGRKRVSSGD